MRRKGPPAFGRGVKLSDRQLKKAQRAGTCKDFAAKIQAKARAVEEALPGAIPDPDALPPPTEAELAAVAAVVAAADRDYFKSLAAYQEPWQFTQMSLPVANAVAGRPPDSYAQALEWFEDAIKVGDPLGTAGKAQLMMYGWGMEPDREGAFKLLQTVGVGERVFALLGQCHTYGWGTKVDYVEAIRCYRMSAPGKHGDPLAQFELGRMYYYHRGFAQSYDDAFRWYKWSAERGYAPAMYCISMMYYLGTAPAIELSKPVISYLAPVIPGTTAKNRASRSKADRQAELVLRAKMDDLLKGTDRKGTNTERALEWFKKAVAQGHSLAQEKQWRYYGKALKGLVPETRPGGWGNEPPPPVPTLADMRASDDELTTSSDEEEAWDAHGFDDDSSDEEKKGKEEEVKVEELEEEEGFAPGALEWPA